MIRVPERFIPKQLVRTGSSTLEFLSKKHVKFDQGLDFLNFCQGNRDENEQNRGKNQEHLRKT